MPYFPIHLLATTLSGIGIGLRVGRPWRMIQGLAMGYAAMARDVTQRNAPSRQTYRIGRLLRKSRPVELEEIEPMLAPLADDETRLSIND